MLPARLADVDERVRTLLRTKMAGGTSLPSISQVKDLLHVGWRRVADVMAESEFTQWPANNAHRCVCRTEFVSTPLFVTHADSCTKWRLHAAAEVLESRWRVQHHVATTGQQPDWTFLSPLPAELAMPLPQASAAAAAVDASLAAESLGNGVVNAGVAIVNGVNGLSGGAAGGAGAGGGSSNDLRAELRDAVVVAASTVEAALRAPYACQPIHMRRVLGSPDDLDPSGVTMELAAAAAVSVRRDARRGETRREQLADAAREAARYNAELMHQRQRRGPFEIDPHTNTIQVLPSWLVNTSASIVQQHKLLQHELRAFQHAALDAALEQHRVAESDVRRLVLDRQHVARFGTAPPKRSIDVAFAAADTDLANPALADFDPLARIEPPQRSVSAYFHYAADHRPTLLIDQPYLTAHEQAKAIGNAWRATTVAVRESYERKAQIDKERYESAMVPWALKHARAQRVSNAALLTAHRGVDFAVGYLPPTERDEQHSLFNPAAAPTTTHPAVAAAVVANSAHAASQEVSASAPPSTAGRPKSARRGNERDDDDDEFVPKSNRGAPRGRRASRNSRYHDDDDSDDDDSVPSHASASRKKAPSSPPPRPAPPTISAAERKLRAQLASIPDAQRSCCVCSGPRPTPHPGDELPEEPFDPTQFDYSDDSADEADNAQQAAGKPARDTYLARLDRRTAMAQRLMLTCNTCYRSFHSNCAQYSTDTALKVRDVVARGGRWQCIECKLCDVCDTAGDENKLLICDLCERSYHTYCLRPPLRQLPEGGWRCSSCVRCAACGTTQPGANGWARDYTLCSKCDAGLAKKLNCPVCLRVHRARAEVKVPMVQCDHCQLWVHRGCTRLTQEQWKQLEENSVEFVCETCAHAKFANVAAAAGSIVDASSTGAAGAATGAAMAAVAEATEEIDGESHIRKRARVEDTPSKRLQFE